MKKTVFALLGLLLITCKPGMKSPESGAENNPPAIPEITATTVGEKMSFLASDELEGRASGGEGIEKAATYIEDFFKSHTIAPYFSTYKDTLSNFEEKAYNIVGVVPGNDPALKDEFIIVGAHYDHVGTGKDVDGDTVFNGANDNASGTVAVMELAKHFAHSRSNKRSLLFVLFSAEERGLLGSDHLAKRLKAENVTLYVMVNFEMIGVPMTAPHSAYITGYELSNMAEKINEYSGKNTVGFLATAKQYQLFKRSDNYPFYREFSIPAQTLSTFDFTNFNYYHHVEDEISEMDFNHMSDLINQIILPLERMANSADQEIKMNE